MKVTASTSRVRTSFDPELELPKLHQWFAENPHPSRLTLQMYVKELNSLASRQSRKLLEVHNLCYWFKNARAAYKRAELRMRKSHEAKGQQASLGASADHDKSPPASQAASPVPTANAAAERHLRPTSETYPLASQRSPSNPHSPKHLAPSITQTTKRQSSPKLQLTKMRPDLASVLETSNGQSDTNSDEMSPSHGATDLASPMALAPAALLQKALPAAPPTLSSLDLASALNCLLATNFTAATAAAAAAAVAASTTLSSGSLPSAANLLPSAPGASAINLAASLLNPAGLLGVPAPSLPDPASLAAAAAAALNLQRSPMAPQNPVVNPAFLESPVRQLFSAFNPSVGYQPPTATLSGLEAFEAKYLDTGAGSSATDQLHRLLAGAKVAPSAQTLLFSKQQQVTPLARQLASSVVTFNQQAQQQQQQHAQQLQHQPHGSTSKPFNWSRGNDS